MIRFFASISPGRLPVLLILALSAGYFACNRPSSSAEITPAFYHWRSSFSPDSLSRAYLRSLPCQRLYLRYFDVDWDASHSGPVPVGEAILSGSAVDSMPIVPTVFITNRTMRQLPPEQVPSLARRIAEKILSMNQEYGMETLIPEWQLDCDWSGESRDRYFALLEHLRLHLPAETDLSATIRLHQVKYARQTGVPPVDRGMLMFYNTGDVADPDEGNSILELDRAGAYLDRLRDYPLPLDVALPLFRWGVLFREGRMIRLINGLEAEALADTTRFQAIDSTRFEIRKNTYLEGHFLYAGDQIRLEGISEKLLRASASLLAPQLRKEERSIAFFHLDPDMLKPYSHALLKETWQIFQP